MEATMLDLRRNAKRVLKAIDAREHVTLTYRGKKKAVIVPYDDERQRPSVAEHPAFGIWRTREDAADVDTFVRDLRKGEAVLMLFDTDVIVWALRGNRKAAKCIDSEPALALSAVSYMELLRGSRNKDDQSLTIAFIRDMGFQTMPIDENVSHRAIIYMEEFALSNGLDLADALIAATAAEHKIAVCTANDKHYKTIPGLTIARFRP